MTGRLNFGSEDLRLPDDLREQVQTPAVASVVINKDRTQLRVMAVDAFCYPFPSCFPRSRAFFYQRQQRGWSMQLLLVAVLLSL